MSYPLDLEAIKQRAEVATEGPWEDFTPNSDNERFSASVGMVSLEDDIALNVLSNRDAEFISHARQDIPDLVAEVERLRGVVDRVVGLKDIWLEALENPHHLVLFDEVITDLTDALEGE